MTTKRNHALKKQQYGIPLPLPALIHDPQQQAKSTAVASQSLSGCSACSSWLSILRPLLLLQKYLFPPSNRTLHPAHDLIQGHFHPHGASVWIENSLDMETLFRQGFFGKGTLSRSEATWKERTTGSSQGLSLEEITRQRRIERAQLKQGKQTQAQQGSSPAPVSSTALATFPGTSIMNSSTTTTSIADSSCSSQDNQTCNTTQSTTLLSTIQNNDNSGMVQGKSNSSILDTYEHLQLSLEEAFFLVFAVECIQVTENSSSLLSLNRFGSSSKVSTMSIQECWRRFAESSILKASSHPISKQEISPDNSFIIRYVAYHHYRSLGWVVKDGLKYGTDFLLYKKGMVFGHSQFGVQVIACKSRAEATSNPGLPKPAGILHPNSSTSRVSPTPGLFVMHSVHSWQWLLALNRVISQVQKTVILCYVIVPHHITKNDLMSPQKALPMYAIVEVGIKRFVPERNRE